LRRSEVESYSRLNVRAVPRMSEKTENVKKLIESLTPLELQSLASYLRSKISRHPLEEKWDITYGTDP